MAAKHILLLEVKMHNLDEELSYEVHINSKLEPTHNLALPTSFFINFMPDVVN